MRAENGKLKTESGIRPPAYAVNMVDFGNAEITFAENIVEKTIDNDEDGQETYFEYDSYTITVPYRTGLETDISANLEKWVEFAKQKDYEKHAEAIRNERNRLLSESDSAFCIDRIMPSNLSTTAFTQKLKELAQGDMAKYRQALRDIPEQEGFPYNVEFPTKPSN